MSLEHEEQIADRLTGDSLAEVNLSPQEKKLAELLRSKQLLMETQSRAFLDELMAENSTLPVNTKNVQITNAENFRESFLQAQFQPLLLRNLTTLSAFCHLLQESYTRLQKHEILDKGLVSLHVLPKNMWTQSSPNTMDIVPVFNIIPSKRLFAKTGTNIGNGEGDGYIQFQLKNLFGGAEKLVFDAVTGTRTPSLYLLNYLMPVNNSPYWLWDTLLFINTRKQEWIQSSVHSQGVISKVSTRFDGGWNFDGAIEATGRALENHGSRSLDVISQLGRSSKLSLMLNAKYDSRDHHVTPTLGQYARFGLEYAGLRATSVNFIKLVWEGQAARKLSENHSLVLSNKAGVLLSSNGISSPIDRFHIGGPNDVRSFIMNGLGPKDQNSAVGGDYFVTGGVSLISHIPKTASDSGFRLHNFVNFGRLLAQNGDCWSQMASNMLTNHSIGVGSGILYNHPMARFELNFVLPLAASRTDSLRKGIQYGVGISFL